MTRHVYYLLKFTQFGHAASADGAHLSGYDSPESWANSRWHLHDDEQHASASKERMAEFPNGCTVLDIRPCAERPDYAKIVYAAPMVSSNPRPAPPVEALAGSPLLASGWGGLLAGAIAGNVNLDDASLPEYLEYWKRYGAKVGRVDWAAPGAIDWSDK